MTSGPKPLLYPAHVAGRGAVTAFGVGRAALVEGVFGGRSAILPRRRTASADVPTAVAAEFPEPTIAALGGDDELPLRAACAAAREALEEARIADARDVWLVLASTKADLRDVVAWARGESRSDVREPGDAGARPGAGPPCGAWGSPADLAHRVAEELGLAGVLAAVSCACASGLVALTLASRRLHLEAAERVLVVGVDVLREFVLAGFGSLHALDPEPCRPFDAARRGVSLGDGAAAIVLTRRGQESVGAAIVGHGGANDACHVTGPDRRGAGLALAAARAVRGAGLGLDAIDLVHLHGTATVANDATEAIGLADLFGGRTPAAFGTKAQTGHALGAAGMIETILAIESLHRGLAPANHGLREPDVHDGLDLVREPRTLRGARRALKVASGFGGIQAAVVIEA